MDTLLQETAGLQRTAPVQSPVPVLVGDRLSGFQRFVVGLFLAVLALAYVANLAPDHAARPAATTAPANPP